MLGVRATAAFEPALIINPAKAVQARPLICGIAHAVGPLFDAEPLDARIIIEPAHDVSHILTR
jgi:hypothetical protein